MSTGLSATVSVEVALPTSVVLMLTSMGRRDLVQRVRSMGPSRRWPALVGPLVYGFASHRAATMRAFADRPGRAPGSRGAAEGGRRVAQASARRQESHGHNRAIAAGILLVLLGVAPVALAATADDAVTLSTRAAGAPDVNVQARLAADREPAAPAAVPVLSDSLSWPVHGAVTGGFHEQRAGHVHQGIDIPAPEGTPIRAAGAGRVVMREQQDGYGNYTCIAHVKVTSCYGHQSRFATKLGADVRRGEVIGFVGHTGSAPVDHLHFEVRLGRRPWGRPVNPL